MKINMLTVDDETWNSAKSRDKVTGLCDCGRPFTASKQSLCSGGTKSCGCLVGTKSKRHGLYYHALYSRWNSIMQRCYNKNSLAYHNYGGRGIIVCERWHKVEDFIADIVSCPAGKLSLERVDNDGNYEPGNVIWATAAAQSNNSRKVLNAALYHKCNRSGKWIVRAACKDKRKYLGLFKTEAEAKAAVERHRQSQP